MAAQLPRPGVEIIQEFQSTSPTVVIPTLVPVNVAPFFEIIEVLNTDGTINDDARLSSLYNQNALTIPQLSFPSPRGNIDEVDIEEDSIRAFFLQNGALGELSTDSGFLTNINVATAATLDATGAVYPVNLDGLRLTVAVDAHTEVGANLPDSGSVPVSANTNIDFTGTSLSLADVVSQINARVPNLASDNGSGQLRLSSSRLGARSSITVRAAGSANSALGFSVVSDQIAVGAGFYAIDDADGDILSPRLQIFEGTTKRDIGAVNVGVITAPNFLDYSIESGDLCVADGVNIGEVDQVFSNRLVMRVEQNIFTQDNRFAPEYLWVQAQNLTFPAPASSSSGSLTGAVRTSAANVAYVVGDVVGTYPIGAGETFDVDVTLNGVAQPTETITSGTGWADLATAIADINSQATNFEAYLANEVGDELPNTTTVATPNHRLGLRLLAGNEGGASIITFSGSTAGMAVGFSTSPVSDVGEDIRYRNGSPAIHFGTTWSGATNGGTVQYTPTVNGVVKAQETVTFSAAHAGDATGLANAITDWNNQTIFTEAYESNASGVETSGGGLFAIRTRNENVGSDAVITLDGGTSVGIFDTSVVGQDTDLDGTTFDWQLDGNPKTYSIVLGADEDDGGTSLQQVIDRINDETPGVASASNTNPPALVLSSTIKGEASSVTVVTGTANSVLGFSDNDSDSGNGRPNPDLSIDVSGQARIQANIIRNGRTGVPFSNATANIFMAYRALRLDLTPESSNPALLRFADTATLESVADPISTDNPGAAMCFLSLLNAPGNSVAAIGVPEVSEDAPDGTPLGYAKCFSFLEAEEVYAISLGTQNPVIHSAAITHAEFMSQPDQKGERIVFFNRKTPDRRLSELLASGTDLNTSATPGQVLVDTNVAQALIDQGIDPANVNPTTGAIVNEVYLDIASDDSQYLLQSVVNGTTLVLRTTFASGDGNADSFYALSAPSSIISDDWSLQIRGQRLVVPGTSDPDKDAIAETIQDTAAAIQNRRAFYVFPESVGINISGLEQAVPGYYATAAIVGMVSNQPPQQGFTNFPIAGLTRVIGSSDVYSNRQLNVMAAGGTYILVQDSIGGPVICRHQLSTDTTSIEKRELSITKVVDFTAKFIRAGLRNFIGRVNITQAFIDQLSTVAEGLTKFLIGNGVLIGAEVNNILQDADSPDTILVDISLNVPYPANYIRVTLVI